MPKPVIDLTRGIPPPEVFSTEDLIQCGETALRRDSDVLLQYGRSPGYAPLREWLGQRYGVGPEQILIGNSSMEIFAFITQTLLQPGDRAFIESPSYDRSITLLRRAGAQVVGIPVEEDGPNLAVLENELKQGAPVLMYVITDFHNPTGITLAWRSEGNWLPWQRSTVSGLPRIHHTGRSATEARMFPLSGLWRRRECCVCLHFPRCWRRGCAWAMW